MDRSEQRRNYQRRHHAWGRTVQEVRNFRRTGRGLCLTLAVALLAAVQAVAAPIEFWDTQRRGTNLFNAKETPQRLRDAKEFGVSFVRLAPNKWLRGRPQTQEGDFLLGRPGQFRTVDAADVQYLRSILDEAHKAGLRVLLTTLSLPNGRWKQHNHNVEERAMWESFASQEQSFLFWRELARALKGHPALVGYNLRNEPSPEFVEPRFFDWFTGDYVAWAEKVRDKPSDLNLFYKKTIAAIREVDSEIPIVLDTGFYATAWGVRALTPQQDKNVLYSFHMYEPYAYNSRLNKGRFQYPGAAPIGEGDKPQSQPWNKEALAKYLEPVVAWQKAHQIPSSRILVGEVGAFRTNDGAEKYLRDVLELFEERSWHWAFYSFREDTWAGMDYELGMKKPKAKYWEDLDKGVMPTYLPTTFATLLRSAVRGELAKGKVSR